MSAPSLNQEYREECATFQKAESTERVTHCPTLLVLPTTDAWPYAGLKSPAWLHYTWESSSASAAKATLVLCRQRLAELQ